MRALYFSLFLSLCFFALGLHNSVTAAERHDHSGYAVSDASQMSVKSADMDGGAATTGMNVDTYHCPMHTHITGEKGDMCPICGMTLVQRVDKTPPSHEDQPDNAFHIDPSYIQTLGVTTEQAGYHQFGRAIQAFGRLKASTRLEHAVDVRTQGWIIDLPVDAVGDTVKKGDLLFTYYSPDLMGAQSDFLIGSRIGNAGQRLRLYGMDDKAIAALKKRGDFLEATPFHAPVDGTVTALHVRKGGHVREGGSVMRLQDFSKLWANIDVPVRDIGFLKTGTPATVTLPETGQTYQSEIDFIHPVNDPQSRTVTVRLVLDNPDGALKPDTYVDAVFDADTQSRLAVPREAVLYGKDGAYVIEALGDGYFRPVMVETGITANGLTAITDGLSDGMTIVQSGQFMLDSESNLTGGMAAMGHQHGADTMTDMNAAKKTGGHDPAEQEEMRHVHE